MDPSIVFVLYVVAYILIGLGLIGAILPVLPGTLLIWLGALIWAWANGFEKIGWPTLLVLGVLTLASWGSDLAMTTLVSRKAGASWKAILAAIVGGILGGIFLSALPVIGTVFGAVLGALAGLLALEYYQKRDWRLAAKAAGGYIAGWLLSSAVQLSICLVMIAIFAWQAFLA